MENYFFRRTLVARSCRSIYSKKALLSRAASRNSSSTPKTSYLKVKAFAIMKDDSRINSSKSVRKSRINSSSEEKHEKKRRKKVYGPADLTCGYCGYTFKDPYYLKTHIKNIHETEREKIYECDYCDYKTTSSNGLKVHVLHHSDVKTNTQCDLCDLIFSTHAELLIHRNEHKPTIDPSNPYAPPTYQCEYCNLKFMSKYKLANHRPYHFNKVYCNMCYKWYEDKTDYNIHYFNEHILQCDICKRNFKCKINLSQHLSRHEGLYVCKICNCQLFNIFDLNNHVKSHKRNKRYCDYCGKGFSKKKTLIEHINMHINKGHVKINNENTRIFKCEICDQVSYGRNRFMYHIEKHRGIYDCLVTCPICAKIMKKRSLTPHLKTHAGHKPYVCGECGKSFIWRKGLDAHSLVHSDNRPHACQLCGKAFKRKDQRFVHEKSCEKRTLLNKPKD